MCHGKTVRGYVTGTTSTSLWTVYNQGLRNYCGNPLRDGGSFTTLDSTIVQYAFLTRIRNRLFLGGFVQKIIGNNE